MGKQVLGLEVVLPDGSVVHSAAAGGAGNGGYDLTALFAGAEGTLGVITAVDLRLHPIPAYRATALCGFADLDALVSAARILRDVETIAALELIDGRAIALADEHLGLSAPRGDAWLLLVELAAAADPSEALADTLAASLDRVAACAEPSVGLDRATQLRLWQTRESIAEVVGCRRCHRIRRSRRDTGRVRITCPSSQRRRSSASCKAPE
jgi:FAD/FMN-containing dehydrogenase